MTDMQPQPTENTPLETEAVFPQKKTLMARITAAMAHPKAPLWAGVVILSVAGAVVFALKGPSVSLGVLNRPAVVLFDPVRFINAQRAAASFLAMTPNADTALALTQVAKQAELVIQDEAHGAVVLVKQAVVAPVGIPDITDAVLTRFGLPTNVPTITNKLAEESLEDIAPTDNAFSAGKLREDYRLELDARRNKLAAEQAKQIDQNNILP